MEAQTPDVSPPPTSSVRSAAEEAILWAAIKDAVAKRYEAARLRALAEMDDTGALKMIVRAADDRADLGTLNTTDGKWIVEVDEDALLAWVQDHRPGEWYQAAPPIKVRDSFVKWAGEDAVRRARAGQAPRAVDGVSGQPIPGVKAVWKPGTTTVTANVTAKGRAAEFLENLFRHARGLPAPPTDGDTDAPEDEPPWAVGDSPSSPHPQLDELRRRVERLHALTDRQPDHPGGDRAGSGGDPGPGDAGPVVPGPAEHGHDRADVQSDQVAEGLRDSVPGHKPFAHPLAHPYAVTVADIDTYTDPQPYGNGQYDDPAPF